MAAKRLRLALLIASTALAGSPIAHAAEYMLMPSPQTVHIGNFNAATKPVLTIESGDIVTIETASAMDPAEVDQSGVVPPSAVPDYTRAIYQEVKDRGPGPHILTGPVAVNGAQPGDVLEVRIVSVRLAIPYAYNGFGDLTSQISPDTGTTANTYDSGGNLASVLLSSLTGGGTGLCSQPTAGSLQCGTGAA